MTTIEQPLVSIIIPTYNRAHIVPRAIQSALNQTYKNIEVIVVDDGSTDDTEVAVREIAQKDARLRYFRYSPNRGGNHARNIGLDNARGDYVTFLDSDDTYLPRKVEQQLSAALRLPVGRPHVVQCAIQYVLTGQQPLDSNLDTTTRPKGEDELASDYIFLNGGESHMPLLMVSTEHARRIRFHETLPKLQDYDWFIRVFDHAPEYAYVPERLATYYISHDGPQVSKSFPSYDVMQSWADDLGERFSPRSRAWLNVNRLAIYAANEGRRMLVLRLLMDGLRQRVVRPHVVRALLARILLPRKVHGIIVPYARRYFKNEA